MTKRFAMLAAVDLEWDLMFLWLVVAFFVDGIDGPLARKYNVKKHAAEFDGVLLDLIIDYLTYVFIPAFALFKSGLLPGWTGWLTRRARAAMRPISTNCSPVSAIRKAPTHRRAAKWLRSKLPTNIAVVEDAVATQPSLGTLFLEYNKLIASWFSR